MIAAATVATKPNIPARLIAIDALKGVSIIGVVCIHSNFQSRYNGAALAFVDTLQMLFAWSVLAFFFAAGFVRFSRERTEGLASFIRRRALQLLVPCAILSVSNRVALEFLSGLGLARLTETRTLLNWLLPVPPQFYFLPVLFMLSSGLEILNRASPFGRLITASALTLLSALAAGFSDRSVPNGPALSLLPFYFSAYCSGAVGGLVAGPEPWRTGQKMTLLGGLAAGLVVLMIWKHQLGWFFMAPFLALLFWCARNTVLSTALAWLGKRSGAIYLWHAPLLLPATSLLVVHIGMNGLPAVVVVLVLSISLSLLTGTMIAKYDRWHLASF